MPMTKSTIVYHYPGHLLSKCVIAQILDMDVGEIQIYQQGLTEGLTRKYVEKRLEVHAKKGNWVVFACTFALAIYGIVLFPTAVGIIDHAAISVLWMVQNLPVNPIPAILAETLMTLSFCHQKKGGKLKCYLQLLNIWLTTTFMG